MNWGWDGGPENAFYYYNDWDPNNNNGPYDLYQQMIYNIIP